MSNDLQPTLWWVFDNENQSFSTLPTGPLLAPALLLCFVLYFSRRILEKKATYESVAGEIAQTSHWQQKKDEYDRLVEKRVTTNNNLDYYELIELRKLEKYLRNPRN